MLAKRDWLAFFVITWLFVLLIGAPISHAQVSYTTSWAGNTYSTIPTYVGNAMRSMWVAPEGVVYTSSAWDESQGSINIYQNGQKSGTIAAHGETQGGAIGGDATYLFAALQFNTTLGGSGYVGRYNRSTKARDLTWSASSDTTERRADVITGIADTGTLVYVSDHPDNLVRCYTTAGVWQSDWSLTDPGAIAVDGSGNIWVAQKNEGTIQEFSASGSMLNTISMGASARPSALYYDAANSQLMVGDQGPNMNIQIYGNLSSNPSLAGSFGVQGGYLDTTAGVKGQTGSQRFTRIVGIGKDTSGNLYVLNNPWGGTWDLGRNGKTDIHAYNSSGVLQYTLQGLNFEGNAAFDPGTDGAYLYSGQDVYSGTGGGGYVGNSVDALDYPTDARLDVTSNSRGFDFGLMASVNGHRILAAAGQNSDGFLFSYFPTNQYVAVPFGSLPGQASAAGYNYANYFNTTARIRNGFCLDTNGDIWVGLDKTNAITHYPLTGFDANGLPIWGPPTTTPTPATIAPLGGIEYIPSTDTMVLMNAKSTDWTSLGGRVEVYHGWMAGNTTNPNQVITLKTSQNPKGRTAAGNYLFISYVHTVPDIDAYNLTTGANDLTMTSADPNVAVGNDVDSMYGIRAYQASNGDYLISKDNYNNNSIIIHRMTAGTPTPDFRISASPSSQTVVQGNNTTYTTTISALNSFTNTVNLSVSGLPTGATASFNPTSVAGSGSSTLAVTTATTTAAGTYTLTITGTSGTLSHSTTVTLVVQGPPDFSISASPSSQTVVQGNNTTYTTSISALNGFTSTVNLSVSGLPSGATASFNPTSVAGAGNSTLTVSTTTTTPVGTYTLTITGTSSTLSHSTTVTLVVQGPPDFSISASPSSQTVMQGNNATYTTSISALNGFTGTVNLSVSGLPTGATASFNPTSVAGSGSSTLTVSTATTTPAGTYTLTITGTSGALSHSTTVTLVVTAATGGLTDQDIGSVGIAGSASYSNGTFTVNGSGTSISGTADQFNYAYQAAGTSYTITARVVSMTNTNSGAQAGVMIRETLATGSTMANINVTPSNGVTWVYRTATSGGTSGSRTAGLVAPYWVRVVRNGSTFTGYFSSDGVNWTQQGTVSISMASNVYIGLVVSSRNNSQLCTATFDNVSVTTP